MTEARDFGARPEPIADQIAAVKREIAMRERVYPKWVAAGRMKQEAADRELAAMRAALATVEAAGSLYENRTSSDPRWLSDLFHAVAPVRSRERDTFLEDFTP